MKIRGTSHQSSVVAKGHWAWECEAKPSQSGLTNEGTVKLLVAW